MLLSEVIQDIAKSYPKADLSDRVAAAYRRRLQNFHPDEVGRALDDWLAGDRARQLPTADELANLCMTNRQKRGAKKSGCQLGCTNGWVVDHYNEHKMPLMTRCICKGSKSA
jgi:hypothetical protein